MAILNTPQVVKSKHYYNDVKYRMIKQLDEGYNFLNALKLRPILSSSIFKIMT
jgi:hypothetical protein